MSSIEEPCTPGATELIPLNPGSLFGGRYRVRRCLGTGGMGAIYEVLHNETERRCVLKTMLGSLLTDPDMRARFKLEATVTANVESDHIVDVYDAGIDEHTGLPYLVMEYLRGETLASRLKARGNLAPKSTIELLSQAALALDRTHAAGIVHRDLKPENLFITQRDDGTPHVKLLDFGIAKIVSQSANINTTRSFGTPLYMSPEQIRGDGDIDGRADLYALAQITFTMLVGHAYFEPEANSESNVYPLLVKVMQGTTVPASERASRYGISLPAGFDLWFAKATGADAAERFDTASEQIGRLAAIMGDSATVATEASASTAQSGSAFRADPATFTGVSKAGNDVLGDSSRLQSRRRRLVPSLALVVVAFSGLYFLWIRVRPSHSSPAVVAVSQTVVPEPTLATPALEARFAAPELASSPPLPTHLASRSNAGVASAAAASSARARPRTKPVSSPGSPRADTQSSASASPARAVKAPGTSAYDPSDIR